MEQSVKKAHQDSVIFALIHGATYMPATWFLKHYNFSPSVSVIIAAVPIITFAIFIWKLIKSFSVMDEVKQRVQLEAVVIGFSLTVMLIMLLFLLTLGNISSPAWFGFGYVVCYCWAFYFIGWFVSKRKYGV